MMNKIIKKIWGVAFVVVLLSSFFVAVPQASAAAQDFSYASLPSDPTAITAPGVEVYDFAVAPSNINTIYAATSANALKSTDQGRTWTKIHTGPAGTECSTQLVSIAPDDADIVAYASNVDLHVRISLNGGTSFYDLGVPQNKAGTDAIHIFDIDVSKEYTDLYGSTYRYVGIAGVDGDVGPGDAAFYYFKFGDYAPFQWYDAVDDSLMPDGYRDDDACFFAVKFSPAFNIDNIVYLLSQDKTGPIELHVCSLNIDSRFDASISSYQYYDQAATGGTYVIHAAVAPVTKGQIIFDPFYAGVYYEPYSRAAYCSVATTSAGDGGAFKIDENENAMPSVGSVAGGSIWSIALNSDGSNLIAASAHSNEVYGGSGPPIKRIGGGTTALGGVTTTTDNMTIAYAGAHVLCAKANDQGAFSLSTDDGGTFNDISLVNTTLDNIDDQVIEQTAGIERYIVSYGASVVNHITLTLHTSVWYWDGTYWERVFVRTDFDPYIARVSPDNFGILYMGDTNNDLIYYTDTHGKADWRWRAAPRVGSNLVDMEVVNNTDFYVATNIAGTGYVCPLTWTGLYWNASDYIAVFGTGTAIASITLVSDNEVIAGSRQTGQVAYTATGGHTPGAWNMIAPLIAGTSVYADATSCVPGSTIYAVSNTGPATVWTYVIGSDASDWVPIYTSGLGGGSAHSIDIMIYGTGSAQCIYYLSGNGTGAAANIELARAFLSDAMLSPPYGAGWLAVQGAYEGGQYPNVLEGSVDASGLPGNQVWFIDTHGSNRWPSSMKRWGEIPGIYPQIITYTDELAATFPVLTSPINGYIIQVNEETGMAYDVTLNWTPAADAFGCTLQVATDKAFTDVRLDVPSAVSPFVIGPYGAEAVNGADLSYQPGEIYYWRVRTTTPYLSAWSDVRELDIQAAPIPVPVLYSPLNDAVVNTLTPSFSWSPMSGTDSTSGITTTYTLQIDTDPGFGSSIVHDFAVTDTTGFQMPDGYITDGHTYYWRVCTDVTPHTNWSATFHFKVDLVAGTTTVVQTSIAIASTIVVPSNATNTTIEQTTPTYLYAMFITCAVLVITIIIVVVITKAR